MHFLIDNWFLVLLAAGSGLALLWPNLKTGGAWISCNDAIRLMNHAKAQIIDISDAKSFEAGSIRGAKNVPLKELDQKLETTVKNKTLPLVLVCSTGSQSGSVVNRVKQLGYSNVNALQGGLKAWREANLPVQSLNSAAAL